MNKKLIIGIVAGVVVLLLLGVGGFFGYKMYTELAEFKAVGSLKEMRQFSQENFDLKKQNKEVTKRMADIEKQFAIFRKKAIANAEARAERKVATASASFMPLSGTYVLAAASTQEQLENCQDIQELIKFEAENFETSDPSVVMQQDKICGTYIERKLIPLFKYQMLRVRASMTGSLGHLRPDAEKKFEDARRLLERWEVPVDPELEKYIRF
ncbi:hypothetical protein [Neptuniibacter sp.]|uniref:hypothetical protein n=1 Tax=Neptuniibacter sp. TaxID=1962643 RepID=UPI002613EAAA|nr:hypothetical protein [Neptuniibacter sp.]MCP4594884.1 hypothetical protein [Neptuniibacter sp.]